MKISTLLLCLLVVLASCKPGKTKEPEWTCSAHFDVIFTNSIGHRSILNEENESGSYEIKSQIEYIQTILNDILKQTVDSLFLDFKKEQFNIDFIENKGQEGIYRFTLNSTGEEVCDEILLHTVHNVERAYSNRVKSRFDNVKRELETKLSKIKTQMDSLGVEYQKEGLSKERRKLLLELLEFQEKMYTSYIERETEIMINSATNDRLFFYVDRKPIINR